MNKTLKRDVEERERAPSRRRFKTWPPLCCCSAGKGCFVCRCHGNSGHNAGAHLWRTAAAAPRLDSRPPASPPRRPQHTSQPLLSLFSASLRYFQFCVLLLSYNLCSFLSPPPPQPPPPPFTEVCCPDQGGGRAAVIRLTGEEDAGVLPPGSGEEEEEEDATQCHTVHNLIYMDQKH